MLYSRYFDSLLISSGDTTKFWTIAPAPIPIMPTSIMAAGTSAILNLFFMKPTATSTAPTTDRATRTLYIHRVMFTSVKPAP